jgi:GH24 family phage-related lysozyme (muramidase)
MDLNNLKQWIAHWEGRRAQAYDDATGQPITPGSIIEGHPTLGIGFNLDASAARAMIGFGVRTMGRSSSSTEREEF